MDVEKVSLKTTDKKHKQVAAIVSVVNHKKDLILWSIIKPEMNICQYFTSITGLEKTKLDMGLPIELVR
jgi:hypothetical protein